MRCLDCRYSLKGLTEHRCPECGREFDPRNPATFKVVTPLEPPPVSVVIFMGVVIVVFVLIPFVNEEARLIAWSYAAIFVLVMAFMIYLRCRMH